MVRELGLERCETVWSLSTDGVDVCEELILVREDRIGGTSGVPIVGPIHGRHRRVATFRTGVRPESI